jgi:ATP-dependent DNA ligase
LKLEGYRAVAIKTSGSVQLRSRSDKDFAARFPLIVMALATLPSETVIEGELVAFDESGRASFNSLQNHASTQRIFYYVFDLLVLEPQDLRARPLAERRELLRSKVLTRLPEPIRYSPTLDGKLSDLINSVRQQKLEGLIAKRTDSAYESGDRSGAWLKMRVNRGQEFVITGYTTGGVTFDALVLGYCENGKLVYAYRTRNGFTPAIRRELLKKMKPLGIPKCPHRQP